MKSLIFILAGILFNFYVTIAQEFSNGFGLYQASGITPDSIPDSVLVSSRMFSNSIPFLDSNFHSNTVMLKSSQNFIEFYDDSTLDSTLSSGLRLLSSSTGNSTSENSFKKSPVVFPSPNAFSFTNIPKEGVDLYNGTLKYELPLYSFKYDNIEVPIVLRYNDGGGVKVNEIASWVGLGWSLIAGGNISRVMHSLPDEYNYTWTAVNGLSMPAIGYLNLQSHGVNLANFNSSGQNDREQLVDYSNFYSLDGYCLNYGGTCPDAYDTEPDEFYFNFGSYSGKFVFKQNGEIVLTPQQDFQISKTVMNFNGIDKIVSFTVITSDGFTYTFGDNNLNSVDESKLLTLYAKTKYENRFEFKYTGHACSMSDEYLYSLYPKIHVTLSRFGALVFDDWFHNPHDNLTLTQMDYFTSSWHLLSITTPLGTAVNFSYTNESSINFLQNRSVNSSLPALSFATSSYPVYPSYYYISNIDAIQDPYHTYKRFPSLQEFTYSVESNILNSKRLDKITANNGLSVEFVANTVRQDLLNSKRLDEIHVKNNGTPFKKYLFSYSNIFSNEAKDIIDAFDTPIPNSTNTSVMIYNFDVKRQDKFRMFLNSVQEFGLNDNANPPYTFEYNLTKLPKRLSFAQDYGGFANSDFPRMNINPPSPALNPIASVEYPTSFCLPETYKPILGWAPYPQKYSENKGVDKFANFNYAVGGVLTKVNLPTCGYQEFIYQNNKIGSSLKPGIRIKTINAADNNGTVVTKNYTYDEGTGVPYLNFAYLLPEFYTGEKRLFISGSPFTGSVFTHSGTVGYGKVTETQTGNGRVEYEFTNHSDYSDGLTDVICEDCIPRHSIGNSFTHFPFPPTHDYDWKRGLPKSQRIFNEIGDLFQESMYQYTFNELTSSSDISYGLRGCTYNFNEVLGITISRQFSSIYSFYPSWSYNSIINKKEYVAPNYSTSLSSNVEYLFSQNHYKNILTKYTNSDQSKKYTATTYVKDYVTGTSWIDDLRNSNINTPIESVEYYEDQSGNIKITHGEIAEFNTGGKGLKSRVYSLETLASIDKSNFKFSNKTIGILPHETCCSAVYSKDLKYQPRLFFDSYSPSGNLLQYHESNSIPVSFKWNYKLKLPVAEFRNSYNDNLTSTSTSTSTGNECGYIGFESNQVGGTFPDEDMWSIPSSCMISTDAHSGYSSLRIPLAPSQNTFSYSAQRFFKPDRQDYTFRFSAWLKTPTQLTSAPWLVVEVRHENGNAIMNGTTNVGYFYTSVTQTNNQWKYIEKTVDLGKFKSDFSSLITPTEKLLLSCYIVNYDLSNSILSDDYRFEALPSSTRTYNYSFADLKLSDITDINSTTSYYNYDDLGRLSVVSDFQKRILNNYTYGFCRPTYCNREMSQYFTTQCGNGQTPSVEVYTVIANKYCSDISQAAANALAQAEIDQNGQSHANAVGTCPTCPVSEEFMIINGECIRGIYIWESEEVIHCTPATCKTKTYYHYEFFTSTGEFFQGPQLVETTACMGC